jgi:hypothetical protein
MTGVRRSAAFTSRAARRRSTSSTLTRISFSAWTHRDTTVVFKRNKQTETWQKVFCFKKKQTFRNMAKRIFLTCFSLMSDYQGSQRVSEGFIILLQLREVMHGSVLLFTAGD